MEVELRVLRHALVDGLYGPARWDMPTGAAVAAAFGLVLAVVVALRPPWHRRVRRVDGMA